MYGTVSLADNYFANDRLYTRAWDCADSASKTKAMEMATRAINLLNFSEDKTDPLQVDQFPRGGSTVVPDDILIATYECAYAYLDGVDMRREMDKLSVSGQSIDSARVTYDRAVIPEHFRAGIPSSVAWTHLKPYLRDPNSRVISRVS